MNFLDYVMRGGEHPNLQRETIEREIAELTLNMFASDPKFHEKGLKWLYNLNHFHTFYCTRTPEVLKYIYEKKPYPEYFELEVSTFCDMRCKLCEHTHWKVEPRNMSFEEFKKIVNQFPNLKWAGMTGIGQSWLNKDYLKMMKYLKDKGVYIENFDNFKHITPDIAVQLIDMGLDKLYVSMDAAKKETFEKIQSGADWDKVIENIKFFDSYKKKKNLHYPELWFHFIVTKENVDEMEDYLQMIHDLNIEVEGVQFTKMLHAFKEVADTHVEITDEKKKQIFLKAQKLGLKASFNINSAKEENKIPIKQCSVWNQPFIFADGTVIQCCSMNEQNDRDWQIKTSLGNLLKEDMRKVWRENYGKMIDQLNSGTIPKQCERCVLYKK